VDDEDELDWLGVDLTGNQPTIKSNAGHNQQAELDEYAEEARRGLQMVGEGEDHVIAGWLAYGAALNKGRKMFPSNEQFGEWIVRSNLEQTGHRMDRVAAMWAAEEPDLLYSILEENPKIRTVRGAHAKWKKDNPPPKPPKAGTSTDPNLRLPTEEEAKRIRNLKDRAASTNSEPEREAVQKRLEKLKEEGIDVDSVVDQKGEDAERDAYFNEKKHREQLATAIAEEFIRTGNKRLIRHFILVAYPKTDELEQFAKDHCKGATNVH
jgi:hypothetical protein